MPPRDVPVELQQALKRLKLSPVLKTLPERLRQARERQMAYEDLLLILLQDEVQRRDHQATRLRAGKAGLDPETVLDAWDGTTRVSYDRGLLHELATLRFIEAHHHVLMLGPVGVGKTFLAHALGHLACARGLSVVCEPADKLLKRLKVARLDQTYEQEMRRLCTVDLLIVDDFARRALDGQETADFEDIAEERHRKASMILTSNRDPDEWLAMLADPLRAQAIVDRVKNNAYELVMDGPSFRPNQKPKRPQG